MKLGIIIQARMSSTRLPGKMMRELRGRPLLSWVVERIEEALPTYPLIVATSRLDSDSLMVDWCRLHGVKCYQGSLEDVTGRYLEAMQEHKLDAAFRICGDSPLLAVDILHEALSIFENEESELVTNIFERTFPKGQSVEIVSLNALIRLNNLRLTVEEREHATQGFYKRSELFSIRNFKLNPPRRDISFAVDTPEDWTRLENFISGTERIPRRLESLIEHWQELYTESE